MLSINFHLRNPKESKEQSIWAVFYIENKRFRIETNQSILPRNWSKDKHKALSSYKDSDKLNRLLNEMTDYIDGHITNIKLKKKRFSKEELQASFNTHFKIGEEKQKQDGEIVDFVSFIENYLLNRKDISSRTQIIRKSTFRRILIAFDLVPKIVFERWRKMSNKEKAASSILKADKRLDFEQIDYNWMKQYHNWLLNHKYPYKKNNIAKEIKIAKHFATAAANAGFIKNISFKAYKCEWEDADNIHLSWTDIDKLKALELDFTSTEGKVRNRFVFNCYLGLRYSDLNKLNKNQFSVIKEQLCLKIRMQKTDGLLGFPVLKSAENILRNYDYQLPSVSVSQFNKTIKNLCFEAGITELETKRETKGGIKIITTLPRFEMVSSHTGRRSFATNFYNDGVPLKQLMAITGHKTEASIRRYIKKQDETEFIEFLAVGASR
ncbi:site-specific integrase [soil metagenome]